MLPSCGVPVEAPAAPGVFGQLLSKLRLRPALAAVRRDLHRGDRAVSRPCPPRERHAPRLAVTGAGHEVGHARRDRERPRHHLRDRLARFAVRVVHPVRHRVLEARVGLLEDGDPRKPLHVLHPVPAGHHQAQREAVLWRERSAVHVVGEQSILDRRQSASPARRSAPLRPSMPLSRALKSDLDGVLVDAGLLDQRSERCAAPLRGAHRLGQPWLAHGARLEERAAVAGAFEGDRLCVAGPVLQGIEGERSSAARPPRLSPDGRSPGRLPGCRSGSGGNGGPAA